MGIFKAYDIRGVVPSELDAVTTYRIGRAVARFLRAQEIAVGRDARASSPEFFEALVRGIRDEGVGVVDLGLCSTPMLYHGVEWQGCGGGVMITASHNPAKYNGFKVCREHAIPVGEASGLREIERLAASIGDEPVTASRGRHRAVDSRERYVEHVLAVGAGRPRARAAIDCGNGMASVGLESLLPQLPLEVTKLYFEPDGTFPNHEADPLKAENLVELQAAVRRTGADFGVAFDGDGDRAVFVDDRGETVPSDLFTALLAPYQLRRNPGATILYDLRSSRVTAEEIEKAGGIARMSRVGHSFVKAQMREQGAVFAGELSGHMYFRFPPNLYADDGTAALVALLDVLAEQGRPLSELVAPLRRYAASGEINRKVTAIAPLIAAIRAEHAAADEISDLDGLLVRYKRWWFNLRPSNTEPVLRLNLEADTRELMEEKRDELLARIERGA
jgi:phosphomannomutase